MKKINLKNVETLKRDEMRKISGGIAYDNGSGCGGPASGCRFHSDCNSGCYCYSINGGSSCRTSSPYDIVEP